jgi:hypothetical protein
MLCFFLASSRNPPPSSSVWDDLPESKRVQWRKQSAEGSLVGLDHFNSAPWPIVIQRPDLLVREINDRSQIDIVS